MFSGRCAAAVSAHGGCASELNIFECPDKMMPVAGAGIAAGRR